MSSPRCIPDDSRSVRRVGTAGTASRLSCLVSIVALALGLLSWSGSAPGAGLLGQVSESSALDSAREARVRNALETVLLARTHADSLTALTMAVDTALVLVFARPHDPEAHYLYAVAVGQRLELSGTREKIRLGAISRHEAEAALALDPTHPGAHHVLGRLNAASMRMGRISRFVARKLLGGTALEDVSWEQAEAHFRRAAELEPDNPRHWMELGALLMDTGRREAAADALSRAKNAQVSGPYGEQAVARARRLLQHLECRCD